MTYTECRDLSELRTILDKEFDVDFWEESLSSEMKYYIFKVVDVIVAIVEINEKEMEINRINVNNRYRNCGVGTEVVNILKSMVYPSEVLKGYSTHQAYSFWKFIIDNRDQDISGLFESEEKKINWDYRNELMYFEIFGESLSK